jgi:hypothetical protein
MSAIFASGIVSNTLAFGNASSYGLSANGNLFTTNESGFCSTYFNQAVLYFGSCIFIEIDKLINMEFCESEELLEMIRKALKKPSWFPDFSRSGNKIIVSMNPYTGLPGTIYECSVGLTTASINCIYGSSCYIRYDISSILEFFVYRTRITSSSHLQANERLYTIYYYSRRNISTYKENESSFKYTLNTFHDKHLDEPMYEFSSALEFDENFDLSHFNLVPTKSEDDNYIPLLCGYNNSFSLFTTGHNIKTFCK